MANDLPNDKTSAADTDADEHIEFLTLTMSAKSTIEV
jgi:hypothetical protein